MKQKLTRAQILLLEMLVRDKQELIAKLREIQEAEQEQVRLLIKQYDLDENKTYVLSQEGEDIFLSEQIDESTKKGE